MIRYFSLLMLLICTSCKPNDNAYGDDELEQLTTRELVNRRDDIDAELDSLARLSYRGGVGNVGYRSLAYATEARNEWIRIDFSQSELIDQVILIPSIWRDTQKGFLADGFPKQFKLLGGLKGDEDGRVIASFGYDNPVDVERVAPLLVNCDRVRLDWIKIDVTRLSRRAWDKKFILQLSEIMAFSGLKNVALRQAVTVSSPLRYEGGGRESGFLVDGFVPYIMDASQGIQSLAYLSEVGIGDQPKLALDLGESFPVSGIHLHTVDVSDTVPQVTETSYALPKKFRIEGANRDDFSDVVTLVNWELQNAYMIGPNLMWNTSNSSHRYIRLVADRPFIKTDEATMGSQIGFAEIEIYSKDKNVALGKLVKASFNAVSPARSIEALTDGRNLYGDLLGPRRWMNELARRYELDAERPHIQAALESRYEQQQNRLESLTWLAVVLATGIITTILLMRIMRMRQIGMIRERLAADLHDELGADIHTIGLLSDLAATTKDDPEQLKTLHRRIRSETERSAMAVRNCTNMLDADGLYADLKEDMERTSRRIMAKLDHSIKIEGEHYLRNLKARTRVDLFLFFKECLINVSKHANATKFRSHLVANASQLTLVVSDNGVGLDEGENEIPLSLTRRAGFLGGKISLEKPEEGGTRIKLLVPTKRWSIIRKFNILWAKR